MTESEQHPVGKDATLTLAEASELVGDDITYWLANPFLDRESLEEKVCWWIARARTAPPQ